jgi:phosphohistidine phosphatase SixA
MLFPAQHGEARPETEAPERCPFKGGAGTEGRTADVTARAGIAVDEARHSEKGRAEQTATILDQRDQMTGLNTEATPGDQ